MSRERKDGSISWYGDRDNSQFANRPDAYLNSTAENKADVALAWAQTRVQDSTGNYIDYVYLESAGQSIGEQLIHKVRWTGKTALPGQSGQSHAPYAELTFNYAQLFDNDAYVAGGRTRSVHRLETITSSVDAAYNGQYRTVRHYRLGYDFGSAFTVLTALTECRDEAVDSTCAAPTRFKWSQGQAAGQPFTDRGFFETVEDTARLNSGSQSKFKGFKFGDFDGDGRQDFAWIKDHDNGDPGCTTDVLYVMFNRLNGSGSPYLTENNWAICFPVEIMHNPQDASWFMVDYTGDGRDDLFFRGHASWIGYRATGDYQAPFDTRTNLLAELAQEVPSGSSKESEPQHADLNGDGLIDLLYPRGQQLVARLMERGGSHGFRWGHERVVRLTSDDCPAGGCIVFSGLYRKANYQQLNDFNGDARSDALILAPATCGGGPPPPGPPDPGPPVVIEGTSSTQNTGCLLAYPFVVESIDAAAVTLRRFSNGGFSQSTQMNFADINGDGLSDYVSVDPAYGVGYGINTGVNWGGQAPVRGGWPAPAPIINKAVQVADVNGDGRADIVHARGDWKLLQARLGMPNGGISDPVDLPNAWTYCTQAECIDQRTMMFTDIDADGNIDFMRIKWDGDGSNPIGFSRPSARNRFIPRDVIVRITNGLGAETDISYAPLTNNAVYRPGTGSRNGLAWGRGSPVQDVLAPMYVVSKAASTSPQFNAPEAKATVHYRYHGARMQAGGRGFLGFARIDTVDANRPGAHVATSTTYHQAFPLTGLPIQTTKTVVGGAFALPGCLAAAPVDACYSPAGSALPGFAGVVFSNNRHVWETAPAWNPGMQVPTYPRTSGSDERHLDPLTGAVNSRVRTTLSYAGHGNVSHTAVDTYTGEAALVGSVVTTNLYADQPARWRLGRLSRSVVTHTRPGVPNIVRTTNFAYAMSGAATGLLTAEHVEPEGGADVNKRTVYTLDEYGNRTSATTCSVGVVCDPSGFQAKPSAGRVNRYERTEFDSRGRFVIGTREPFLAHDQVNEHPVQRVLARDMFGNVETALDPNNVRTISLAGALGRPAYAWTQSSPSATPGQGGVEQRTQYRWCGSDVPCPTGARYRQRVMATAAPTKWTYFDALGRPMMEAAETFNAHVDGKDVSAVCTRYDAAGNAVGTSNPFFLPGTAGDLAGLDARVCLNAANWTVTDFDSVGRVRQVTAPNQTRVQTAYSGLTTTITNPRSATSSQERNGYGEVVRQRDSAGLDLFQRYDAAGRVASVRRNAGAGDIVNSFFYDALGRKVEQFDPDTGRTAYTYNALGELQAQHDAGGHRIEYEHDGRGRVWRTTTRTPDGTVETQSTVTYDSAPGGLGKPDRASIGGTYAGWRGQAGRETSQTLQYAYDAMGRPTVTETHVAGEVFRAEVVYDALSRTHAVRDATGRWAKTEYSARGFAGAMCESAAFDASPTCSDAISRTRATDAFGNAVDEARGSNGQMQVLRRFNPVNGRLRTLCAGVACALVDEAYEWDFNGNLATKRKGQRYLEGFTYDVLDRLVESRALVENGVATGRVIQAFAYDGLGNICVNNGVQFRYDAGSPCGVPAGASAPPEQPSLARATPAQGGGAAWPVPSSPRPEAPAGPAGTVPTSSTQVALSAMRHGPHAVTQTSGQSLVAYGYDARGNQTLRNADGANNDRSVHYTSYSRAYEIDAGGALTRFRYGVDGSRYLREDGTKRTYYLGNVELVIEHGVRTMKRTVGGVMQQTIVGQAITTHYLFHDHQGSVVAITDAAGVKQKDLDYAAFGTRRDPANPSGSGTGSPVTTRGYTGHEHVDAGGLIHMNARLFDPVLGRFLQPDPMVQDTSGANGWNAYSYVLNNPLRYTDPTGMLGVEERRWAATALIIASYFVAPYVTPYLTKFGFAVAVGSAAGGVATGSWKGALQGAFSAALFYGIGSIFEGAQAANSAAIEGGQTLDLVGNSGLTGGQVAAKALSHAIGGGVMAQVQGGKFGHGFVSAGVAQLAAPYIDGLGGGGASSAPLRIAVTAIVGGTVSALTGGKFANGAITAAFSRAFNDEIHLERSNAVRNAVIRAKNAVLRPFGKEDVLVIGEDMQFRVIPYARKHGHDWYGPKTELPLGHTAKQMAVSIDENIGFVVEKMNQGYTIIDIGPQQGRTNYPLPTSPWYMAEVVHVWTRNSGAPYEFLRPDRQPSRVNPH